MTHHQHALKISHFLVYLFLSQIQTLIKPDEIFTCLIDDANGVANYLLEIAATTMKRKRTKFSDLPFDLTFNLDLNLKS